MFSILIGTFRSGYVRILHVTFNYTKHQYMGTLLFFKAQYIMNRNLSFDIFEPNDKYIVVSLEQSKKVFMIIKYTYSFHQQYWIILFAHIQVIKPIILKKYIKSMSKQVGEIDPFRDFFVKMNNDLAGWLRNEKDVNTLLEDYNNTLSMLEQDYDAQKIMVNIGQNCYLKAKKANDKIVIRCKQDIYVQFNRKEAIPVVKSLISLYQEKVKVCKQQICKIMSSMREMQTLIAQYQTIM